MQRFYSNGKLLITGEYLVLDGALALAIPTSYGQSLTVTPAGDGRITWRSKDEGGVYWFEEQFDLDTFQPENSGEIANVLSGMLLEVRKQQPDFLKESHGEVVETELDFPRNWGLGSSSTLVNNVAQWANVDPYQILRSTFGGSGYDIAAAGHDRPILFRNTEKGPWVKEIDLMWDFTDRLFFVYLNKKQNSRAGISSYRSSTVTRTDFEAMDSITELVANCTSIQDIEKLFEKHEKLISAIIGTQTVKENLFPDYQGSVKSLGAWGGDFVMVTGEEPAMEYFRKKGYNVIIPFEEMIK